MMLGAPDSDVENRGQDEQSSGLVAPMTEEYFPDSHMEHRELFGAPDTKPGGQSVQVVATLKFTLVVFHQENLPAGHAGHSLLASM